MQRMLAGLLGLLLGVTAAAQQNPGTGFTYGAPSFTNQSTSQVEVANYVSQALAAGGALQPQPSGTILGAACLTGTCTPTAISTTPFNIVGPPVYRIDDFLASLAVNTHVSTYQTPSVDTATIVSNLQYVGARGIRDALATDPYTILPIYQAICAAGIKLDLLPLNASTTLVVANNVTAAANVALLGTNCFKYLEQPNEPDLTAYTYNGVTATTGSVTPGFIPVSNYMAAYYTAAKANALLNAVPVLDVSDGGNEWDDAAMQLLAVPYGYVNRTIATSASTTSGSAVLNFTSGADTGLNTGQYVYCTGCAAGSTISSLAATAVTLSANTTGVSSGATVRFGARLPDNTVLADVLNLHVYPSIATAHYGACAQSVDPVIGDTLVHDITDMYVTTVQVGGGGPYSGYAQAKARSLNATISEYGYQTVGATAGGAALDPLTAAKNLMTAWLNAWYDGFQTFTIYELFDDSAGGPYWGLFSFAESPKLGATYLHNFTTVLADASPHKSMFVPTSVAPVFANLPSTARYELFQNAAGTLYAIIWNNVTNWNIATGTETAVSGTSVTVTFNRIGSISEFDPTVGTTATQTVTGNTVTISLADYPLIVAIT